MDHLQIPVPARGRSPSASRARSPSVARPNSIELQRLQTAAYGYDWDDPGNAPDDAPTGEPVPVTGNEARPSVAKKIARISTTLYDGLEIYKRRIDNPWRAHKLFDEESQLPDGAPQARSGITTARTSRDPSPAPILGVSGLEVMHNWTQKMHMGEPTVTLNAIRHNADRLEHGVGQSHVVWTSVS
jgi:hypothetical protein